MIFDIYEAYNTAAADDDDDSKCLQKHSSKRLIIILFNEMKENTKADYFLDTSKYMPYCGFRWISHYKINKKCERCSIASKSYIFIEIK